jgi:hypothetical protein
VVVGYKAEDHESTKDWKHETAILCDDHHFAFVVSSFRVFVICRHFLAAEFLCPRPKNSPSLLFGS